MQSDVLPCHAACRYVHLQIFYQLLYKSPFTDIAPQGPDQVFDEENVVRLLRRIEELNEAAVA